jgi:hypothetical protein
MTPREPDRFDKQALELVRRNWIDHTESTVRHIAAALRAAEASALERVAQVVEDTEIVRRGAMTYEPWDDAQGTLSNAAKAVRALIPPAAAPAASVCAKCGKEEDVAEHCDGVHGTADAHEFEPAAAPAADPIHEAYLAADEYGQPPAPAAETDAPNGPVCGCGRPSRYESGWCGETSCFANVTQPSEPAAPAAETGKSLTPELTIVTDYGTLSTGVNNGDNNGAQASEGSAGGVREAGRLDETAGAPSRGGGSEDTGARVAVPVRSVSGRADDALRRDGERNAPVIGLPSKANAPNDLLGVVAAYPEQAAQFIDAQEALLRECEKAFLVLKKDAAFMSPALHVLIDKLAARTAPPKGEGK